MVYEVEIINVSSDVKRHAAHGYRPRLRWDVVDIDVEERLHDCDTLCARVELGENFVLLLREFFWTSDMSGVVRHTDSEVVEGDVPCLLHKGELGRPVEEGLGAWRASAGG